APPDRSQPDPPTIRLERFTPTAIEMVVQSPRATTIRLPMFWFPGWRATVNGAPAVVRPDGPLGLLAIETPPGPMRVVVAFGDTPIRVVGVALTAIGVVGLLAVALGPSRHTPGSRRRARNVARFWVFGAVAVVVAIGLALWLRLEEPPAFELPAAATADAGPFRLLAYQVRPDGAGRGGAVVTSVWQTRDAVPDGTEAIVRLLDSDGHVIASETRAPRFGTISPARWSVGDIVWDRQAIVLPPGTPATSLILSVGWRLPDGVERLATIGPTPLPPTRAAPDLDVTPLDIAFVNGVTLVGAHVTPIRPLPLGLALPAPDDQTPPGLDVTLVWQTDRPLRDDLSVVLQLSDGRTVIAQADSFPPLDLRYTSLWRPGWPVLQRYRLILQSGPPGRYDLRVGLYARPSLRRVGIVEGGDSARLATYRIPPGSPTVAVNRRVGPVTLEGFDRLDGCGATVVGGCALVVRLIWRVEAAPNDDLTVFVHVLGPDGRLVAQHDGPPAEGRDPTRDWQRGDRIADERRVTLPPALPPGEYLVVAGLYRA
ncbi:MAG: hypothetical protein NZ518_08150, partial [Dehalococcoidia bacterium]|nr:hypothetical protein [Dehalococcoidia bacterium]